MTDFVMDENAYKASVTALRMQHADELKRRDSVLADANRAIGQLEEHVSRLRTDKGQLTKRLNRVVSVVNEYKNVHGVLTPSDRDKLQKALT